jgi:tetratricopeptide (TPR) repeat protein
MPPLDGVDATGSAAARAADLEQLKQGAALLTQHGNRVAALAVLWAAVAIDPQDHAVHRRLAATLASSGDLDAAAQEYARYVEYLLPRDLAAATAELHYAARTLGSLTALSESAAAIAAELPAHLRAARERVAPAALPTAEAHDPVEPTPAAPAAELVTLPVAHPTRVTFHTCLHDDGEAAWFQLEGGTATLLPEKVRLLRGGTVLETRRCIPMPAGRKSHARPDGDSRVWVVLRAPEEMLRAIDRDEADDYSVEALVDGEWLAVDLEDTGCRFGMKRREAARTA